MLPIFFSRLSKSNGGCQEKRLCDGFREHRCDETLYGGQFTL